MTRFRSSVQAKLKQLANDAPTLSLAEQSCISTALSAGFRLQSLIACGMWRFGAYNDHTWHLGVQLSCMLPPLTSAMAGPLNTGHVLQAASGNRPLPGYAQLPCMLPPLTSAIAGPLNT